VNLFGSLAGMRRLWRWYQQSLSSYPVRTQVVSSGILWALGDIGAQAVTHKSASSHHHHAKNPEVASQPPLQLLPSPATDPRIPWSFLDAVAPQLTRSPGSGDFPGVYVNLGYQRDRFLGVGDA
uniref:Uncharacterized protein n=1 Tax=Aegilops tauschii subsp. strangulata TaxID=200361 RepID=A0A453EHQ9_AEGTS